MNRLNLGYVTCIEVERQESGKVIKMAIEVTRPLPRKQQILLRYKAVAEP